MERDLRKLTESFIISDLNGDELYQVLAPECREEKEIKCGGKETEKRGGGPGQGIKAQR